MNKKHTYLSFGLLVGLVLYLSVAFQAAKSLVPVIDTNKAVYTGIDHHGQLDDEKSSLAIYKDIAKSYGKRAHINAIVMDKVIRHAKQKDDLLNISKYETATTKSNTSDVKAYQLHLKKTSVLWNPQDELSNGQQISMIVNDLSVNNQGARAWVIPHVRKFKVNGLTKKKVITSYQQKDFIFKKSGDGFFVYYKLGKSNVDVTEEFEFDEMVKGGAKFSADSDQLAEKLQSNDFRQEYDFQSNGSEVTIIYKK